MNVLNLALKRLEIDKVVIMVVRPILECLLGLYTAAYIEQVAVLWEALASILEGQVEFAEVTAVLAKILLDSL